MRGPCGFLGLQTGSIGFEGSDAIENLLGGVTLLIYSSRTLPLSGRTAFLAFVVKDLGYYSGLFLLPITLGAVAGVGGESLLFSREAVSFSAGLVVALVLSGVSIAARSVGRPRADAGSTQNRYARLAARFGGSPTGALAAKTVLDVHRSSGGLWKLGLSSTTLLGASYVVLELVARHVPIDPSYGVLFGAIEGPFALGLSVYGLVVLCCGGLLLRRVRSRTDASLPAHHSIDRYY